MAWMDSQLLADRTPDVGQLQTVASIDATPLMFQNGVVDQLMSRCRYAHDVHGLEDGADAIVLF